MKPTLLILRPEPGNSATAARAAALGWGTIQAPLFTVSPIPWSAPDPRAFDAVMLTSANAARLGAAALARFTYLPLYAVGRATAEAARQTGFSDIRCGSSDAEALIAQAAADGITSILHLAGREHRPAPSGGIMIDHRIVYAAEPADRLPDQVQSALGKGAVALLHSPRAAALFADLLGDAGIPCANVRIAAISPAALAAAGTGWQASIAAPAPDDEALLAAAARLCN